MSKPLVIGLVGQNANQALSWSTLETARYFEGYGYDCVALDIARDDFAATLLQLVETRRPLFAFGLAGVGASLSHEGVNLWSILRIPFLSMLFDHPCYLPERHKIASRWVTNCYYCRDFYDAQTGYIRSDQLTRLLTPDYAIPPAASILPWGARDISILFLKTGGDPDDFTRGWRANLPPVLADFLLDCAALLKKQRQLYITDLVHEGMKTLPPEIAAIPDLFWKTVRTLDDYIRRWRADRMTRAMLDVRGAVIVGPGWDHLDRSAAKAAFRPALPAGDALLLYGRSRIVANTNPFYRYGVHERLVTGLKAGAGVISDRNDFSDEHLYDTPNLFGIEWHFEEPYLHDICHDAATRDFEAAFPVAQYIIDRVFTPGTRLITEILHIVEETRAHAA